MTSFWKECMASIQIIFLIPYSNSPTIEWRYHSQTPLFWFQKKLCPLKKLISNYLRICRMNIRIGVILLDWLKWFSFISDPFVTRPLQSEEEFDKLFVKTASISKEFSSFVNQVTSSPFLKLVVGKRGMGKSTALQYAVNLCHKSGILAIYVGLYPYGIKRSKEPVFEIARQLMHNIIQEFISSVHESKHSFFLKYKSLFIKWGRFVGLNFDEVDGFTRDPTVSQSFDFLRDILFGFLDLAQRNNIRMMVAIDNLDKLDAETVKMFLRGTASQPLFEKLNGSGASILIASDPDLVNMIDEDPDFSFLSQRIILEPLSPIESENLISRRIRKYAMEPSREYYDKEAISHVCHEKRGITRDILSEIRGLFIKAFDQKSQFISLELARTGSARFREIETYYEIIKDDQARRGAEKLLRLVYHFDEKELLDASKTLMCIYRQEPLKLPVDIAQALIEEEIILSSDSMPSGYNLDFYVYGLIRSAEKNRWDPVNFLNWILRSETVEIVRIQTPGFRAKRLFDRFIFRLQGIRLRREKIKVVQNQVSTSYIWKNWLEDMISRLERAKENFEIIDNTDIEDADKNFVYKQIYYILKDFLLFFSKCFAAIRTEPIQFRSNVDYIDSWDFITASILTYQKDKNMNFRTFRFIRPIRDNNTAIMRRVFTPTERDIAEELKHLEEIISEFSHELENMLVGYIPESTRRIPKAESEFHEALRSYVDKLAQKMGYDEDLDQYRVFKVDGKEYVRLGFYKSVTDSAELDIVRRRKETGRKDGKIRYHYLLAEIKREKKQSDKNEVLLFLKKCKDLIRILESESIDLPQILKPEYTLWFISYAGFTPAGKILFGRTQKPPRTHANLIDISRLNKMLREYNLRTYPIKP